MIESKKQWWIAGEFCATLDRDTAKIVSFNVQKVAKMALFLEPRQARIRPSGGWSCRSWLPCARIWDSASADHETDPVAHPASKAPFFGTLAPQLLHFQKSFSMSSSDVFRYLRFPRANGFC